MKTLLYGLTLVILYANLPQPFYENSMNGLSIIPKPVSTELLHGSIDLTTFKEIYLKNGLVNH